MAYFVKVSTASTHFVSVGRLGDALDNETEFRIVMGHRMSPQELDALSKKALVVDEVREIVRDFHMMRYFWTVSEAFRDMVEVLDPGVHQFVPITFVNEKDEPFTKRFSQMNILNRVDAVDIENSDVHWSWRKNEKGESLRHALHISGSEPELTLQKSLIEGLHVWKGKKHLRNHIFFSTALMEQVKSAGLIGLDAFKTNEI